MRTTLTLAVVALAGWGLSAQTPSPAGTTTTTVTGCLEAGPNNTFVLTSIAAAGTKGTSTRTTTSGKKVETLTYTLVPNGKDLKGDAGRKVQISGTATPPEASASETYRSSAAEQPKGTSGETPVVGTTERAQIMVRQLSVSSIRTVAPSCDILK
jgi:hypothetical protein